MCWAAPRIPNMGKASSFVSLFFLMSFAVLLPAQEASLGHRFYLATCGMGEGCGISLMEAGGGAGLRSLQFLPLDFASYMAFSPDGKYLYVSLEHRKRGGLASFQIGEDGFLTRRSELFTPGLDFCHLVAAPGEKYVYAASYGSGKLVQFTVEDGVLTGAQVVLSHEPGEKGEAPHLHYATLSPDGRELCLVDLGLGVLESIPLEQDGSLRLKELRRTTVSPPGSGPRHLVFSQKHPVAYLVNEMANTVMTWRCHEGDFTLLQSIPIAPAEPSAVDSYAAAIRLSPQERWLLVSNRGRDSLAALPVGEEGLLEASALQQHPVDKWPRDFAFLPGKEPMVAVACERGGAIQLFSWDPREGLPTVPVTEQRGLVRPLAILPLP